MMDIRLEVLRIDGAWVLAPSGPGLTRFRGEREAVHAAIEAARKYHLQSGGTAVVHVWHGAEDTPVFAAGAEPIDRKSPDGLSV
jgi:hypothetical protein